MTILEVPEHKAFLSFGSGQGGRGGGQIPDSAPFDAFIFDAALKDSLTVENIDAKDSW